MSRRRNNSDDSSDDDDDGGRARKRRRGAVDAIDIEDRLESLITRIGEKSTSSLESNLEGLAAVLENDLPNYKSKILKILMECVLTMPERLSVYTTLIGLLNAKNYNAGGEFVDMLARHVKEALRNGEYESVRQMVCFLADLVNCRVISAVSIMTLFNTLVDVINEDRIPQSRSDWYVYTVLAALPYVGQELFQKKEKDLDKLLETIGTYILQRQKTHVAALCVWSTDDLHPAEERIDCLWAQIQNLRKARWIESHILRPYLAFDGLLSDAMQHPIPTIIAPSHSRESQYPLPEVVFRMFDYTDVPEKGPPLPNHHSIERYLIEDHLHFLIDKYHTERKQCAEVLLSISKKDEIPLNYMIVEALFAQLFHLPQPPFIDLFYGSLLIELCKLQPSSMPQVLAQASEILYDRLDTMNTACIERFSNWFSYHLSNFQFKWSWDDWNDCVGMNPEMPKPKFVRETLLKCLRLSYHQRVTEIVPPSFAALLPAKAEPDYKYQKEGAGSLPGTTIAHKLMQAIKSKCSPVEAEEIVRELPNPLHSTAGYNPLIIDVFVQTLMFIASKSFSHSFAAIAKFHPLLKSIGNVGDTKSTEEAQVCILRGLFELWKNHQQMLIVLVDKLLKTQVVECSAVASWLFSPEMSADFTSFYVWEIMHSTIKKMNKQVNGLQQKITVMRGKLEAHERRRGEGFSFDDDSSHDVPTESAVEEEEDRLRDLQSAQKNLFIIIFQRFVVILSEHIAQCETNRVDFRTPWFKWVFERLQQVFFLHHDQVRHYIATLESLLFTVDIDAHIVEVFQQFCALYS